MRVVVPSGGLSNLFKCITYRRSVGFGSGFPLLYKVLYWTGGVHQSIFHNPAAVWWIWRVADMDGFGGLDLLLLPLCVSFSLSSRYARVIT